MQIRFIDAPSDPPSAAASAAASSAVVSSSPNKANMMLTEFAVAANLLEVFWDKVRLVKLSRIPITKEV